MTFISTIADNLVSPTTKNNMLFEDDVFIDTLQQACILPHCERNLKCKPSSLKKSKDETSSMTNPCYLHILTQQILLISENYSQGRWHFRCCRSLEIMIIINTC